MSLRFFSLMLVVSTLVLIMAGGLVTSHEAGLAVPDWPLSYGKWFPPMVGNVLWEHGHRMIAGTVGLLTLILAGWVQTVETRPWLRRLAWLAFLAVILQAVLGGLTVIYLLPPAVSIFHAVLAQTFFCMILAITFFLHETDALGPAAPPPRALFSFATGLTYCQLILGAVMRHTGHALIPHVLTAFAILFIAVRIALATAGDSRWGFAGVGLAVLVILQWLLGFGAFIFTRVLERSYAPSAGEILFASAHQTVGALVLGTSFLMTLKAWR